MVPHALVGAVINVAVHAATAVAVMAAAVAAGFSHRTEQD